MFKAAVLVKQNKPLQIMKLKIPNLDYGQVLVRMITSGICGRQIQEIFGYKGEDKFLPHLLGHEGSAVVESVGPGVSKVKKGDKVILHWRKSQGIESPFPQYINDKGIKIGGGLVTTFNEMSVVSENRLSKIPLNFDDNVASLLGCALSTSLGIVNNEAKIKIGESVLIVGSGSTGLSLCLSAKLVSGYPVAVVDINRKKLKMAKKNSDAQILINKNDGSEKIKKNIFDIFGKKGPEKIIETSGSIKMISLCYDVLAPNGTLVLVGQPKHNEHLIFKNVSKNYQGKKIIDSQGGGFLPEFDIPRFVRLYESGLISTENVISNFTSLKRINSSINQIKKNKILGKCIINF